MKKSYWVIIALIILLYVAIILDQTQIIGLGELFGYLLYAIIAIGLVSAISLFVKPVPKKE